MLVLTLSLAFAPALAEAQPRPSSAPMSTQQKAIGAIVLDGRTGVVLRGGDHMISTVNLSHARVEVSIEGADYEDLPEFAQASATGVPNIVVRLKDESEAVTRVENARVSDLMDALARAGIDGPSRIAILRSIKAAGALPADLLVK